MSSVRAHFSKYGKIASITLSFGGSNLVRLARWYGFYQQILNVKPVRSSRDVLSLAMPTRAAWLGQGGSSPKLVLVAQHLRGSFAAAPTGFLSS